MEIVNDDHRYLLVTGPKKSAKTISIVHKAIKHMWEVDNSHVGIVVKRHEAARIGVWPDLTDYALEKVWQQEAGVPLYHLKPKVVTETKRRIFSVYNSAGGISKCTLVTAYRASEIEEILKQTRFSFIYVNEADQFPETIFNAASDQLRMTQLGIPDRQHQLVLDCNPPASGEKHWLYKKFISDENKDATWHRDFAVIRCKLSDNPWLTQREIDDLVSRYRSSPRLFARYVEGTWVPTSEGSVFEDVFSEQVHVVGERLANKPSSMWPILLPPRGTNQIYIGWDPGEVNHSAVFFTKRIDGSKYVYDILEDVTFMSKQMSIRSFTKKVMERMEYWTNILKVRDAELVSFKHWSDPSAWGYKASSNSTIAKEIYNASEQKILLKPVKKGPNSVDARVTMMTNLLLDRRILISVLADNLINALIGLKPGPRGLIKTPTLIHAFDAATYGISGEIGIDLDEESKDEDENKAPMSGQW